MSTQAQAPVGAQTPAAVRRPWERDGLVAAALWAGAALLSAVTALKGIQPNDEGLMLQAAARIAHGQVPYSDFWWFYPPGQPYLLGWLWEVFGPSLLVWRIVRVLCDATVALLAWRLARRAAPGPFALAAWLAAALAMAFPSGPHPYPIALATALGALLCFERRLVWAGLLVGVCAAWRLEFAAFAAIGILAALAARPAPGRVRDVARFAGAGLATGALLYLPVVLAAGLRPTWELVVRYPLVDFRSYQQLPLRLSYTDEWAFGSAREALDTAGSVLHFYLPVVLLAGLAAALVALGLRFRRAEHWPRIATALFALGMASYLWTRPDYFHAAPLEVVLAVLAAWAIAGRREVPVRSLGVLATAGVAVAALALAWVVADGTDHRVRGIAQATVRLDVPPGDGVRAEPDVARPLAAAVAQVRRLTPRGGPIYVSGARNDLVTAGAPLFYVLAERPNPTRYDIAAPGILTSARVQREIVGELRQSRPAVAVRWLSRLTDFPEPNRAGRSTGVRILDEYLASTYRPLRRYGEWQVLVRRA